MYKEIGFNIEVFHRDNEFKLNSLREHIRPASLNIFTKGQHISIIESSIQSIKQGARCTTHSVPYKRYTNLITRSLVECIINSIKSFPRKGSIIKILGSNTVLLGKPSPDFNMKRIFSGSYAMVYTGTKNTLKRRSIPINVLR